MVRNLLHDEAFAGQDKVLKKYAQTDLVGNRGAAAVLRDPATPHGQIRGVWVSGKMTRGPRSHRMEHLQDTRKPPWR